MDRADKIAIVESLIDEICQLNHYEDPTGPIHQAVNTIIVPMGFRVSDIVSRQCGEAVIMVCQQCQDSLVHGFADGWTLFFCTGCGHSQWARLSDPSFHIVKEIFGDLPVEKINWVRKCKKCNMED